MQTLEEQEELKKAYEDGKLLERSEDGGKTWKNCARVGFRYPLKFDFETFIYRVKEDSDKILQLEKDLAIIESELRDKTKEANAIEEIRDNIRSEIQSLKAQRDYTEFKGDWMVECLQDRWINMSIEDFINDVSNGCLTYDDGSVSGLCVHKSTGKLYRCSIDMDDFVLPDNDEYTSDYERDNAVDELAKKLKKEYSSKNGFAFFGILWFNK